MIALYNIPQNIGRKGICILLAFFKGKLTNCIIAKIALIEVTQMKDSLCIFILSWLEDYIRKLFYQTSFKTLNLNYSKFSGIGWHVH